MNCVTTAMVSCMCRLLYMSTIWGEVEVFRIILEVVLFKKVSKFLPRGKLDTTRTVDVDIPSSCLFTMLSLFQFPYPAMWQGVITEFENLGQVSRSSTNLYIAV